MGASRVPDEYTTLGVQWNRLVGHFDVAGLAEQIESVGAGYCCITIGRNSGHYLAANTTYDRCLDIRPSKCSRRDLVADLRAALTKRRIKLMVCLPNLPAILPCGV